MVAVRQLPERARPAITPRQEPLRLEPTACLPRGFALLDEAGGLQLVRERDGARLGFMASVDFACDFAASIARIDAHRIAQTEATS